MQHFQSTAITHEHLAAAVTISIAAGIAIAVAFDAALFLKCHTFLRSVFGLCSVYSMLSMNCGVVLI